MTTERRKILRHIHIKGFCDFSLPFLLRLTQGTLMETLFLSLQNARVFFELAFQKKNLTGKTSHKYSEILPVNKYIFKPCKISSLISCLDCKGLLLIYTNVR